MIIFPRAASTVAVLLLLVSCFADAFHPRSFFTSEAVSTITKYQNTKLFSDRGGGASSTPTIETKQDFSSQVSTLFSNIRVPAALFAGAAAGSAFALPILPSDNGLMVGLAKRIYALLMIGALASELIAIVVSTTSMATLTVYNHTPTFSVDNFITENYEFEWTATLTNFFSGMLSFAVASGIRAWITIACPIVARAALGVIASSTLLAISFLHDAYKKNGENFMQLPCSYLRLLFQNARRDSLFFLAITLLTATYVYVGIKTPHICRYLLKK